MKRKLFFAILIIFCFVYVKEKPAFASSGVQLSKSNFSQDMCTYLAKYDVNKDKYLSDSELREITSYENVSWDYDYDDEIGKAAVKVDFRGLEKCKYIKSISLDGIKYSNLKLESFSRLSSLSIDVMSNDKVFDCRKLKKLRKLKINSDKKINVYYPSKNKITELQLTGKIVPKKLSKFKNLRKFTCTSKIKKLDLLKNKKLKKLFVDAPVKKLLLPVNLEDLSLQNTQIRDLNLTANKKLENLSVGDCGILTSINISGLVGLKNVEICGAPVKEVDIASSTDITSLTIADTQMSELDLKGSKLRNVYVRADEGSFNINGIKAKEIEITMRPYIGQADRTFEEGIAELRMKKADMKELNLYNMPNIVNLTVDGGSIEKIIASEKNVILRMVEIIKEDAVTLKEVTIPRLDNSLFTYLTNDMGDPAIKYGVEEYDDERQGKLKIDNTDKHLIFWIN